VLGSISPPSLVTLTDYSALRRSFSPVTRITDPHAVFTRFWSGAKCVYEGAHDGRDLSVYESAPADDRKPSYLCEIGNRGTLEGWITLVHDGSQPRIQGFLVRKEFGSYSLKRELFAGGTKELVEYACRMLDYNYEFPADAGVTRVFGPLPSSPESP
jgi:hypothetical protein